ncbi:hypothetical protein BCR39DRAFT_522175 [Naematelia encephala]|uniref:Homeobox domain-containing protein n=1 Tax=Naematelia encephala TaxID=71784 RepID=A0A1Y2BDH2_9TREE|nr:hypothetical protein BCR39DRAFT_522175 [Naematelia encephala]
MSPSTFNNYRDANLSRINSECEAGPSCNVVRSPLGVLDGNTSASENTPRLSPMPHGYSDLGRRMPQYTRFLGEQDKRRVQWAEANGDSMPGARKRTKYGPGSLEARIGENVMPSSSPSPRNFHKASTQAAPTFHHGTLTKPHNPLPTDTGNLTVPTKRRVMLSPPKMYQSDLDAIVVWPLEPFAPFPGEVQSVGINPWGENDRTRAKYSTADYRVLWTVWTSEPLPRPVACARLGAFLGKSTDKMTTWFSNRRQDSKRGIESGTKTPQIHPHPVDSQETAAINMILSGVMTRDRFFQRYPQHPQFCQAIPQDRAVKNDCQPKLKEVVDVEVKDVMRSLETRPSLDKACRSQEGALARRQYQHLLDRLPTEEPSSDPVDLSDTEDDEEEEEEETRETSESTGVASSRYRSTASSESEPVHDMWDSVDQIRRPMTPTSSFTAPPSLSWTPSSWTTRSPFTPTGYPRPTLTHRQSCDRTTLNLDDQEDSIEYIGLDKQGSRSLVPLPLPLWITESGNTT